MARTLPLLDAAQRRAFDSPPQFTLAQRQLFFSLPEWAEPLLRAMSAAHMRGGFLLQLGYFKASGRFFAVERFTAADRTYVQAHHQLGAVDWSRYDNQASFRHRPLLLHHFGVQPFEQVQAGVLRQITHFARQQMNPVAVFHSAADYVRAHRWEVPTYATLASLVTEAFRTVEQQLTTQLAALLTPDLRQRLDTLFTTQEEAPATSHRPYRLTTLKRSLEVMRPSAIRANVRDYAVLQDLFIHVYPVVQALALSEELVRYYARYVERAQIFQVQQQAEKKYLMVLCFVVYQYYQVGDLLTETLLQAVQTHRNAAQRETQERVYRHRSALPGLVATWKNAATERETRLRKELASWNAKYPISSDGLPTWNDLQTSWQQLNDYRQSLSEWKQQLRQRKQRMSSAELTMHAEWQRVSTKPNFSALPSSEQRLDWWRKSRPLKELLSELRQLTTRCALLKSELLTAGLLAADDYPDIDAAWATMT